MTARQTIATSVTSLILVLASIIPILAQTPVAEEAPVYIGHSARLTATIPSDWAYDQRATFPHLNTYSGEDGFVSSVPIPAASLEEACAATATILNVDDTIDTTWNSQPACKIDGMLENRSARTLVVGHPYPFTRYNVDYAFAAISTDPDHFETITSTVSFEPDRVAPRAYLSSVIDMVEANAWFGTDIDWEFMRPIILDGISTIDTVEAARGSVSTIVNLLYAYGDNHSFLLFPEQANALQQTRGFGMVVGGTRIIALFPMAPPPGPGSRSEMSSAPSTALPPPTSPASIPVSVTPTPIRGRPAPLSLSNDQVRRHHGKSPSQSKSSRSTSHPLVVAWTTGSDTSTSPATAFPVARSSTAKRASTCSPPSSSNNPPAAGSSTSGSILVAATPPWFRPSARWWETAPSSAG